MRKFIIKDTAKNTETVLPVTPPSFEISHGIKVETINIHTVGEVSLPGRGTLSTVKIDCMLPSKKYPFVQPKASIEPYDYIKKFKTWCDNHTILRFIVSDTTVNLQVIISDITYGEKDGSGDVYATISLREYRKLSVIQANDTKNNARGSEKTRPSAENYVVKSGDTLSTLCRKFYGNSSLDSKLAAYNSIKNKNLIYAGQKINLPDKSLL
jgi:nucleoid-associated protein YgaU